MNRFFCIHIEHILNSINICNFCFFVFLFNSEWFNSLNEISGDVYIISQAFLFFIIIISFIVLSNYFFHSLISGQDGKKTLILKHGHILNNHFKTIQIPKSNSFKKNYLIKISNNKSDYEINDNLYEIDPDDFEIQLEFKNKKCELLNYEFNNDDICILLSQHSKVKSKVKLKRAYLIDSNEFVIMISKKHYNKINLKSIKIRRKSNLQPIIGNISFTY